MKLFRTTCVSFFVSFSASGSLSLQAYLCITSCEGIWRLVAPVGPEALGHIALHSRRSWTRPHSIHKPCIKLLGVCVSCIAKSSKDAVPGLDWN